MIETENQSDSRVSRLGQQNEDLLVAGNGNKVDGNGGDHREASDQAAAAATTATTVEDAGENVCVCVCVCVCLCVCERKRSRLTLKFKLS